MKTDSRMTGLLRALVDFSYAKPWLVLAVFAVIGAGSTWLASTLEFHGDFIELLPEKSEEVQDLHFVEQRAGGGGYVVVQVLGESKERRRAFATEYAKRLEEEKDLVRYVESRFDIEFFKRRALHLLTKTKLDALKTDLALRIQYEKKVANPLYVDLEEEAPPAGFTELEKKYSSDAPASEFLESQDGNQLYLNVKPVQLAADLNFNRRLIAKAKEVAHSIPGFEVETPTLQTQKSMTPPKAGTLQVNFTGAYVIRVEEDEVMQADLARAAAIALIISFGIILAASRRLSALVIVAAPVLLGVSMTFAFARIIIGHLNPVTGFLGAILIGLGIEYGVHLSMRYWEEREHHGVHDALTEAVLGTFSGALTSAFTNAAAFFVLVIAEFDAFRQFGKIAAFGVLATVVAAYAVGPAILAIAERIRPFRPKRATQGAAAVENAAAVPSKRSRGFPTVGLVAIMGVILAFMGYSLSVASSVGFERDLKRLKGESPATELDDEVTRQLGIIMSPALIHVETLEDARRVAEIAQKVSDDVGPRTSISKVASINDFVPYDVDQRKETIAGIRDLVQSLPKSVLEGENATKLTDFIDMTNTETWGPEKVPLALRRRFSAIQGTGTFVLIFPRYGGYNVDELQLWRADLNEVIARVRAQKIEAHLLDGNRLAAKIFELIKKDGPKIMLAAALVVFVMIWISLRSLKDACIVAGPLYVGMACIFGAMHLFDVHLNFLNVVVLPNLLAIAVDNSVHLFHRYHEEGPGSLGHIMKTTGFAAIVATLSNAAGYGAMLVARHEGLRSVGVLAVLGVTCTFVGTTIFFPSLLAMLERLRGRPSAVA